MSSLPGFGSRSFFRGVVLRVLSDFRVSGFRGSVVRFRGQEVQGILRPCKRRVHEYITGDFWIFGTRDQGLRVCGSRLEGLGCTGFRVEGDLG